MGKIATLERFPVILVALIFACLAACNKTQNQVPDYAQENPANGNLAPVAEVGSQLPPEPAEYEQPVEAREPPPPMPEYRQPPCPGEDYAWTPGYWDYSNAGYYWVPGAWVMAPWVGALWTPPWWGYDRGVYLLHAGYWGPHIGFYGGIDYGYGYPGRGYYGAYWNHGSLAYNAVLTNVDTRVVRNVYEYRRPYHRSDRISYNGGSSGVEVRATAQELAVSRDPRTPPVIEQIQHNHQASTIGAQFASGRGGAPAALTDPRPISTSYRAPQARPPAFAMRGAAPPPPEARARAEQNQRPAPQQFQYPGARPVPYAVPPEPNRAQPQVAVRGQQPPPQNRPVPEARPVNPGMRRGPVQAMARPEQVRPAPEQRAMPPQPAPQARPAPQQHAMVPRPIPQARPEPQRAMVPHSIPQARPEAQRAMPPQPIPQARPAPQRVMPPQQHAMVPRPIPQARPEAQRAMPPQPAPQARPAPQQHAMVPRPIPEARPAPQRVMPPQEHAMAPHPMPQARQAPPPPQQHQAPPPKQEERKKQ